MFELSTIKTLKGGLNMEYLFVPKDKYPLDFLAEMGDRNKNSWIFLHESIITELRNNTDCMHEYAVSNLEILTWKISSPYYRTKLFYSCFENMPLYTTLKIISNEIAFKEISIIEQPDHVFLLKMAA